MWRNSKNLAHMYWIYLCVMVSIFQLSAITKAAFMNIKNIGPKTGTPVSHHYRLQTCVKYVVRWRYNTLIFLKKKHNRHHIIWLLGQGMGYPLWVQTLTCFRVLAFQYHAILDHVVAAPDFRRVLIGRKKHVCEKSNNCYTISLHMRKFHRF